MNRNWTPIAFMIGGFIGYYITNDFSDIKNAILAGVFAGVGGFIFLLLQKWMEKRKG